LTCLCQGLANYDEGRSLLHRVIETYPGGNEINASSANDTFQYHDFLYKLSQVGPGTRAERSSVAAPMSHFLKAFVHTMYTYKGVTGVPCHC
jgi:hypothetical protein